MTDAQFVAYVEAENDAQIEERMVAAMGTAAAIAQTFGGKQTKALQSFERGISGNRRGSHTMTGSPEMSELRRRIKSIVDMESS